MPDSVAFVTSLSRGHAILFSREAVTKTPCMCGWEDKIYMKQAGSDKEHKLLHSGQMKTVGVNLQWGHWFRVSEYCFWLEGHTISAIFDSSWSSMLDMLSHFVNFTSLYAISQQALLPNIVINVCNIDEFRWSDLFSYKQCPKVQTCCFL